MRWIFLLFLLISCSDNINEDMKFYFNSLNKNTLSSYTYPTWWTGTIIPIVYDSNQVYHSYNVTNNVSDLLSETPYYISTSGSDLNNGLSEINALATMSKAISLGAKLVYISAGFYDKGILNPGIINRDLAIIGVGDVYDTKHESFTWSLVSGIYESTTISINSILDKVTLDGDGYFTNYIFKSSIAEVQATSGTWWYDGSKTYVNPLNATSDLLTNTSIFSSYVGNSFRLYIENITYTNGISSNPRNNLITFNLYMKNVKLPYPSRNDDVGGENGITINSTFTIFQNCISNNSNRDNFNYHNGITGIGVLNYECIEIDCEAKNPSYLDINSNNQSSTAHDGMKMLRINGSYLNGNTQVIADTNSGTESIILGSTIDQQKAIGGITILQTAKGEAFKCNLLGLSSPLNITAEIPETLVLKNCNSQHTQVTGDVIITL